MPGPSVGAPIHGSHQLSQRLVDETLRRVLAKVGEDPPRLTQVLDESEEPLVAFTAAREILTVNRAAERFFGHSRADLIGACTDVLIPARLRQPDAPPMLAVSDLTSVDLPSLHRDGSERPTAWTFGFAPSETGPIFVLLVRDRVQLDDALEALHVSEERFRLLVEGVREYAIFMLDTEGRITTWNANAERIKGWPSVGAIGLPYEHFFTAEDREDDAPARILRQAREKGSAEATGWRLRYDGSTHYVESFVTPLYARDGNHRGYAVITHDLTERLRAAENERRLALETAARKAAEAAEARARLSEERIARVHRLALALSSAVTLEELAAATFRACTEEIAAVAGAVYLFGDDPAKLDLLGEFGHPSELIDRFRTVPLDHDSPLSVAARTRQPAFYESRAVTAARHPSSADVILKSAFEACAAMPLVSNDACIGVLGIQYREQRSFDDAERATLLTMSELCSQAFERARLLASERKANRAKDELYQTLRESEERYATLFDKSPFPLVLSRMPEAVVVAVNRAFEQLFELDRKDMLGKTSSALQLASAEERAEVFRLLQENGRVRKFECERITKSGRRLIISLNVDRVMVGGREHVLSTIEDISTRRAQERALANAMQELESVLASEKSFRREAETANRSKDEFLATMSHELRTPLNAILGWANLLKSGKCDATKVRHGIEVIERNAHAQSRIVSDLLDVSRIVSGKLLLSMRRTQLAAVVHAAAEVVQSAAEAKGVHLEIDVQPDVGEIFGDPDRLQQVIWNLLSNAIKFTPSSGKVSLVAHRSQTAIVITVQDTGAGIPAEHLPHVFERFRQVDSSSARLHGGLGLGLAIVRHLVEGHGGTVSVASAGRGQGSTFTVSLPIPAVETNRGSDETRRGPELSAESVSPSNAEATSVTTGSMPDLRNVRALVVDDDADSLELLRMLLEGANARVTVASSAREALEQAGPFDIIVSDIGMPGMDGYSFMRLIRSRDTGATIPAIALTAYARTEDVERAVRNGYQQHLAKPVDPKKLLETVLYWARLAKPA